MTPMQKMQNQFRDFKDILERKLLKEVVLNKAEPKDKSGYANFCGEQTYFTNAVKSDFIKLYQSKELDKSIGISFSYLDIPEEDWTVKVSLKTTLRENGDFLESVSIPVRDFKEKFNGILKILKDTNPKTIEIIELMKNEFELESINKTKVRRNKM